MTKQRYGSIWPTANYSAGGRGPVFGDAKMGDVNNHPGQPKGIDTIPAWLTPGEYVFSPPAVKEIGVENLEAINNTATNKAKMNGSYPSFGVANSFTNAKPYGDVPQPMRAPPPHAPIQKIKKQDRHGNMTEITYDTKASPLAGMGLDVPPMMEDNMDAGLSMMADRTWDQMNDWNNQPVEYAFGGGFFGKVADGLSNWWDNDEESQKQVVDATVAAGNPDSDLALLTNSSDNKANIANKAINSVDEGSSSDQFSQNNAYATIASHEGFRDKAYQDSAGVWSIGYGRTRNADGSEIQPGQSTNRNTENQFFKQRVDQDRQRVLDFGDRHGYDWNPDQVDSLTSFIYNLGPGGLTQLTQGGTRSNEEILTSLPLYNKAGGKEIQGLSNRRAAEARMFGQAGARAEQDVVPEIGPYGTRTGEADYLDPRQVGNYGGSTAGFGVDDVPEIGKTIPRDPGDD